ncbi:hypothetical protein ALC56_01744 [Trachymyrmex septentrionalis]|uniref:Uncharacterized protein n=1 Tax=Trachymyrmex septentrionalis TaxID=34720 RepID=A0A195FTT4_9HYME|nr:hypothetical protein ALC56_01744 [Trachymyrmex septentrionalis]
MIEFSYVILLYNSYIMLKIKLSLFVIEILTVIVSFGVNLEKYDKKCIELRWQNEDEEQKKDAISDKYNPNSCVLHRTQNSRIFVTAVRNQEVAAILMIVSNEIEPADSLLYPYISKLIKCNHFILDSDKIIKIDIFIKNIPIPSHIANNKKGTGLLVTSLVYVSDCRRINITSVFMADIGYYLIIYNKNLGFHRMESNYIKSTNFNFTIKNVHRVAHKRDFAAIRVQQCRFAYAFGATECAPFAAQDPTDTRKRSIFTTAVNLKGILADDGNEYGRFCSTLRRSQRRQTNLRDYRCARMHQQKNSKRACGLRSWIPRAEQGKKGDAKPSAFLKEERSLQVENEFPSSPTKNIRYRQPDLFDPAKLTLIARRLLREHTAFSIGTNARVLRLTTVEHADAHIGARARAHVWVHRIRGSGGGGVGVRIGRKEVGDGTRDTSLGRERGGQREWGTHGLPSPHPVNVDIHHKSIHMVSDRDEENTHPAQGVAARSQKRRAFIFCPFELVTFRSNGDITMEWEPIANRFTPRCLIFASLVETRLRRSCAVE